MLQTAHGATRDVHLIFSDSKISETLASTAGTRPFTTVVLLSHKMTLLNTLSSSAVVFASPDDALNLRMKRAHMFLDRVDDFGSLLAAVAGHGDQHKELVAALREADPQPGGNALSASVPSALKCAVPALYMEKELKGPLADINTTLYHPHPPTRLL